MSDIPSEEQITRDLNALVESGKLLVTKIKNGVVKYQLSPTGNQRAEEVIAETVGISVADFRRCPKPIQAWFCKLACSAIAGRSEAEEQA